MKDGYHRGRWWAGLAGILLSTFPAIAAEPPLLAVPPCFGDNGVLQQCGADRRDSTVVIWGWCVRGAEVEVELPGQPGKIDANRETWGGEASGNWRRWWVAAKDLKKPLPRLQNGEIRLHAQVSRRAADLVFTNIAIGTVWVIGTEDTGLPLPESASVTGIPPGLAAVRWLPANGLVWTNWFPGRTTAGIGDAWISANQGLTDPPSWLSVATAHLSEQLSGDPAALPCGLILVNRAAVPRIVTNQNVGGGRPWSPGMARLLIAAKDVSRRVEADYERNRIVIGRAIRQAKRRGEVWRPTSGPVELRQPTDLEQVFDGPISSLGCGSSGALW